MSQDWFNRAAVVASSAAQLSRRATDFISEHAQEYAWDRDAKYLDGPDDKPSDVHVKLASSTDLDRIQALKKIIGACRLVDYDAIVKLVSTRSFELRRLVYMYILRYAEQEQELALLSINSFQRDVYDDSPIIRAMALRVLSGIRIKVVAHIVALAIEKCAVDESSYVRKAAALAIPKLIHVDQGQLERMGEVIKVLLGDRSALTLGSTVVAFNEVCRERMDIVHPFYHRLCFALMDADEWSQCALLDLLMRYARRCFVDPTTKVRRGGRNGVQVDVRHFYSSEESDDEEEVGDVLDADHELLLSKAEPLLESRNAGVGLNIVDDVVVGGDGSSCPIRPRWHAWRPKADSWSHAAHPATVHTRHSTTCAEQHQGTRGAAPLYRMFLQPNKYL